MRPLTFGQIRLEFALDDLKPADADIIQARLTREFEAVKDEFPGRDMVVHCTQTQPPIDERDRITLSLSDSHNKYPLCYPDLNVLLAQDYRADVYFRRIPKSCVGNIKRVLRGD